MQTIRCNNKKCIHSQHGFCATYDVILSVEEIQNNWPQEGAMLLCESFEPKEDT